MCVTSVVVGGEARSVVAENDVPGVGVVRFVGVGGVGVVPALLGCVSSSLADVWRSACLAVGRGWREGGGGIGGALLILGIARAAGAMLGEFVEAGAGGLVAVFAARFAAMAEFATHGAKYRTMASSR